ncbi:MAG: RagB/SusD family nutrient uptake outer membrane protein, partial [Bacteroidales bacterium]
AEPRAANHYGRADRTAAWMVLAKLYLNAEVYIGQPRYTECIAACTDIINAGYSLEPEFRNLFNADNHLSTDEIIFRIPYHGINTQTYGGTSFIIHAQIGGAMSAAAYGADGGWGGLRTTKSVVNLYPSGDPRALFFTEGQELEIEDLSEFTNGYASVKFTNITRDGNPGSNLAFPDTDFPMFRLADVYLMYAEAVLRGGAGGDAGLALQYVNQLRQRAFGNDSGNISAGQLTLDFILDERARELFWEAHRRTDLIRFGKFAGETGYVWAWKGNSKDGLETNARYNLFPIPAADLSANPNLTQNQGY